MMFKLIFSKQAKNDIEQLTQNQKNKLKDILQNVILPTPHKGKHLTGKLKGYLSLRLNLKDRIVYRIDENLKIVYIIMCKSHYND